MMRPRATSEPRTLNDVLVRVEADLVVDPHRRDHHAELAGDLAADHRHAPSSVPPRAAVDERHEPEADAELERVDRQLLEHRRRARPAVAGVSSAAGSAAAAAAASSSSGMPVAHRPADRREASPPMNRNGSFGRPGTSANAQITPPATIGALRWRRIWAAMSRAEVAFRGRARDDDAGRDRDQQRRDLRGQAVADGQQREGVDRRRRTTGACCSTPTTMPPIMLIDRDQHPGHRVALDELRGAVHRAVEVGLAGDLGAPRCAPARR